MSTQRDAGKCPTIRYRKAQPTKDNKMAQFIEYPVNTPVYVETFLGPITGIYRGRDTSNPGRVIVEVTATRHGYKKGARITPTESFVVPREHFKKGERTNAGKWAIPG